MNLKHAWRLGVMYPAYFYRPLSKRQDEEQQLTNVDNLSEFVSWTYTYIILSFFQLKYSIKYNSNILFK